MRDKTKTELRDMLARQGHGTPDVELPEGAKLDHDLGLDSYDKIELILMIEAEMHIEVIDDEFDPEMTFGQLVDKIEAIREKAPQA